MKTCVKKLAVFVCLLVAVALAMLACTTQTRMADKYSFIAIDEHSTITPGKMLKDSAYYSDEWFFENPEVRNDELALMSMQLMAASAANDADGVGSAALQSLGFEEVGYTALHDDPEADCAFLWGKKTIGDGKNSYTLVAVVIQAYSSNSALALRAWEENVIVNGDTQTSGEHYCWGRAAAGALDAVAGLAGSGQVKYWICGHSRGGAITNILSAHLAEKLGSSNAGIYAYAFEPPTTVDAGFDNSGYGYIHNYVCSDDVVTMIPLWGMTRYGVVHEIKADTDAGLYDELVKLGSDAAYAEVVDVEEQMRALMAQLELACPTRADFSAAQGVSFMDEYGNPITLAYSYQEVVKRIVDTYLTGELTAADIEALLNDPDSLYAYAKALVEAVKYDQAGYPDEANPRYWTAAVGIRALLVSKMPSGMLSLSETDLFAIFKAAAPALIDTSYEEGGNPSEDILGYAGRLFNLMSNAGSIVFSHQYDTGIARLKVLAPQPPVD